MWCISVIFKEAIPFFFCRVCSLGCMKNNLRMFAYFRFLTSAIMPLFDFFSCMCDYVDWIMESTGSLSDVGYVCLVLIYRKHVFFPINFSSHIYGRIIFKIIIVIVFK